MKKSKVYEGTVILGLGHSLICNELPEEPQHLNQLSGLQEQQQSFGLYKVMSDDLITELQSTTGSPNGTTNDNFIYPIFRGLSEVIVRKSYDPIDFTKNGVLKSAMSKLVGQTVYTNHWAYIGNQVGVITRAFWDNGYTADGVKVPAGINIQMKIDAKNNPQLADSMTMDPPAVHSNSVTVAFKWEQSHPLLGYSDFREKVGTYDDKGELIRRIVTEIKAFTETSIVPHGADPYAKMVGPDGKIINPNIANAMDSFSLELPTKTNFFFMSYKDQESFGYPTTIPSGTNNNNNNEVKQLKMKKEHVLLLAQLSGFPLPDGTAELDQEAFEADFDVNALSTHLDEHPIDPQELLGLQDQVTQLTTEKEALESEVEELKKAQPAPAPSVDADELAALRGDLITQLTNDHALIKGEAPSEATLANWNKSNHASLKVLSETYKETLNEKFPITCKSCGGHEVTRASSNPESGKDEGQGSNTLKGKSAMEIVEYHQNR